MPMGFAGVMVEEGLAPLLQRDDKVDTLQPAAMPTGFLMRLCEYVPSDILPPFFRRLHAVWAKRRKGESLRIRKAAA